MLRLLRRGDLPDRGGVAVTILLTMSDEQLRTHTGLVTTGHGARISVEQALRMATDARLIPIVFGKCRQVAAYGTGHRIFTPAQRLAMTARDGGCSFPGCDKPPAWCEAHHVTDWALTHRTTIDDGTLVCGFHHREHPSLGWTCQMIDGIPHWTAPAWMDPTQTPQRNRMHHPAPV